VKCDACKGSPPTKKNSYLASHHVLEKFGNFPFFIFYPNMKGKKKKKTTIMTTFFSVLSFTLVYLKKKKKKRTGGRDANFLSRLDGAPRKSR
jgi:hypothetical protein